MQKRTSASRACMSMDPVRQAYKRRMELIDRVCEVCASGGLTSELLEKFAPESRLIESEIRCLRTDTLRDAGRRLHDQSRSRSETKMTRRCSVVPGMSAIFRELGELRSL